MKHLKMTFKDPNEDDEQTTDQDGQFDMFQ